MQPHSTEQLQTTPTGSSGVSYEGDRRWVLPAATHGTSANVCACSMCVGAVHCVYACYLWVHMLCAHAVLHLCICGACPCAVCCMCANVVCVHLVCVHDMFMCAYGVCCICLCIWAVHVVCVHMVYACGCVYLVCAYGVSVCACYICTWYVFVVCSCVGGGHAHPLIEKAVM